MNSKKIRNATRVIVLDNNKVLAIQYISEINNGYYDLPGGKIETYETSIESAIREVKEKTGLEIHNLEKYTNTQVEYENCIFKFDVYISRNFKGELKNNTENKAIWIDINKLIKEEKVFPTIKLLEKTNLQQKILHIKCNNNHKITNIREMDINGS